MVETVNNGTEGEMRGRVEARAIGGTIRVTVFMSDDRMLSFMENMLIRVHVMPKVINTSPVYCTMPAPLFTSHHRA